jgi:osmotically-inducible protein OsmY
MFVKNMALAATVFGSMLVGSAYAQTNVAGNIEDANLANGVRQAIEARPALTGDQIRVRAAGGVVYLYGAVDTPTEEAMAESIAQKVDGVHKVVNATSVGAGGN